MQDENAALAARVEGLERAVSELTRRMDEHLASSGAARPRPEAPDVEEQTFTTPPPRPAPAPRRNSPPKSAEWWLARGGALLTVFALILLYQYAVDRNWITPMLRIFLGTLLGAVLMFFGNRTVRPPELREDAVGLRELLMGAALAAWYITAYAAGVFYELISLSTARLLFLALSIAGAALGLREKRALLAFFSLAVGFSVPMLLSSPTPSIPPFTIYLAALTALGLVLYLMRGWQSVLWLTFFAFWWSVGSASGMACCSAIPGVATLGARISLSILIALATAAMVRVPILRRRLLATGSDLYTETPPPRRSIVTELSNALGRFTRQTAGHDSLGLWIITPASPVLAAAMLSVTWPGNLNLLWGALLLGTAAVAYALVRRTSDLEEMTHVLAAGAAGWSLFGLMWLVAGIGDFTYYKAVAGQLLAAAIHAYLMLRLTRDTRFVAVPTLARLTAFIAVIAVLMLESGIHGLRPYLTAGEVAAIATAIWSSWLYRHQTEKSFVVLTAILAYIALLAVDARVLGDIFRPLVTASYAVIGTLLLFVSRRFVDGSWARRLGGLTLVLVIGRLLVIDLAGLETIWRVLLFLGIGALFLFTSYRLQNETKTHPSNAEPAA